MANQNEPFWELRQNPNLKETFGRFIFYFGLTGAFLLFGLKFFPDQRVVITVLLLILLGVLSWRIALLKGKEGQIEEAFSRGRQEVEDRVKEEARELKMFHLAIESTADSVMITDREGVIEYVNQAFEIQTGYRREEAVGKTPRILKSGQHSQEYYKKLWEGLLSGKPILGPTVNRKKNGELFHVEQSITPVRDAEGNLQRFISVWKNITEKIRGEEERKEMEKQILQMQKMEAIGTLSGGIAHDFNNILSIIMGYTDLALITLVGTGEKLKVHRYLEEINHTVERGASLTKQLLLFSRKQSYQPILLNLNETIEELFQMLQRILGEDIEFFLDLHPVLWTVFADKSNMEQIIINLTVNSRDAMPEGGRILVKTSNISFDQEHPPSSSEGHLGQFVCLSVQDWGKGIPQEVILHIFEPFYTTKEKGKGTGLGLSVVYGIVKQHSGWIELHSGTGEGTSFNIFLPRVLEGVKEKKKEGKNLTGWQGNGKRILVVEDEKGIREFAQKGLEEYGYSVFVAATLKEAREIFQREKGKFHLMVLDVVLPDGRGPELVEEFLFQREDLKLLFASGYADSKSDQKLIKERGYPFLQKPFSLRTMLETLARILED